MAANLNGSSMNKAEYSAKVVIVGCGIAGLAAAYSLGRSGHQVTVVEANLNVGEVGAGIQLSPNVTRILLRWGIGKRLQDVGVTPLGLQFHRYADGDIIGYTPVGDIVEVHGSPYYNVNRKDLFDILREIAEPLCQILVGDKVVSVDPAHPSVTLASSKVISADFILGADGIHSVVRDVVLGESKDLVSTGDAAYRATLPAEVLRQDPDLRKLVEEHYTHIWMGPQKHMVAYPIRGGKEYNMVMTYPDDGTVYSWTQSGDPENVRTTYAGWEPRVAKLHALIKNVLCTKLMIREPLKTWVHEGGRVTLIGDACHPMLPYRAQGAAMAIEDAAVLGKLFTRISSASEIPSLLHAYQSLRYPRATATQNASKSNQGIFHLPDGPHQEARDKAFRAAMEQAGGDNEGNANAWADKAKNAEAFGYDADLAVEEWWESGGVAST